MAQLPDGSPIGSFEGNRNILGAGGWATSTFFADDGTQVLRCDTTVGHIRRPGSDEWERSFRPGENVDISGPGWQIKQNCYDIAICKTDSQYIYQHISYFLWRSADGGETWELTTDPVDANTGGNDNARVCGKPLEVDPIDGDTVFLGTSLGLRFTHDGGETWTWVDEVDVPASLQASGVWTRMCIVFDRSGPTSGGRTQRIYVHSGGNGLFVTEDGGLTWAEIADAGPYCAHMAVGDDGIVHLIGDFAYGSGGDYRRWDGEDWNVQAYGAHSIAISPHNAGHIYIGDAGTNLRVSLDNGLTFSNKFTDNNAARLAPRMKWLQNTREGYMSAGNIAFDPLENTLWCAEGIGTWKLPAPPTTAQSVTWQEASIGLENLVISHVEVSPDGTVLPACHDRATFGVPHEDVCVRYPNYHAAYGDSPSPGAIAHGMADWALDDPDFLVACIFPRRGAYSTDCGRTWQEFPGDVRDFSGAQPYGGGGNIVALSTEIFIQLETNNGKLMRTTDGGETWSRCTIGNNLNTDSHGAYTFNRVVLVKCRYTPGTAYYYHNGDGSSDTNDLACRGLWKTTDWGATWTRVNWGADRAGGPDGFLGIGHDNFNGKLVQIGVDDFIWTPGHDKIGVYRWTDDWQTQTEILGTDQLHTGPARFAEAHSVSWGAPRGEGDPPVLAVIGHRTQLFGTETSYAKYGFWLSFDDGETWERTEQFPAGYFGSLHVAGHPTIPDLWYFGTPGEGVVRYQLVDRRSQS